MRLPRCHRQDAAPAFAWTSDSQRVCGICLVQRRTGRLPGRRVRSRCVRKRSRPALLTGAPSRSSRTVAPCLRGRREQARRLRTTRSELSAVPDSPPASRSLWWPPTQVPDRRSRIRKPQESVTASRDGRATDETALRAHDWGGAGACRTRGKAPTASAGASRGQSQPGYGRAESGQDATPTIRLSPPKGDVHRCYHPEARCHTEAILQENSLAESSATAAINAPSERVDIPSWCFSLRDDGYQACSPAHYAVGTTAAPDGRRMSINVEVIGGSPIVQHYVEEIAEPDHLRFVSHSDLFTRAAAPSST